MLTVDDPYRMLQVIPEAEPEVIQAAYHALARKYHPDMGGSDLQMAKLNAAWETVRDRPGRERYDREQKAVAAQMAQTLAERASPARRPTPTATGPRPMSTRAGSGTVLDFGRYVGFSLGELAVRDPDYLLWLARTSIGRRFQSEIAGLLAAARPPMMRAVPSRSRFARRR
jgi:curved DNA-binding protein CbpA